MKKNWLILGLVGLFLVVLSGNALAWSSVAVEVRSDKSWAPGNEGRPDKAWSPRIEGKPDQFRPGGAKGYYIWHDEHGFHVWTTTRGAEHVFSGVVTTDGKFVQLKGHRLEGDDKLTRYSDVQNKFLFHSQGLKGVFKYKFQGREVNHEDSKINFKFETAGGSDGFNFRVKDGSQVTFELYMDGRRIDSDSIYIGDNGGHPRRNKFTFKQSAYESGGREHRRY